MKWHLVLLCLVVGLVGCSTNKRNKGIGKTNAPKASIEISDEVKEEAHALIRDRKFFEAYTLLSNIEPKDDWVVANMLFTISFLKKIGQLPEQDNNDALREKAKDLIGEEKYYEALEVAFLIEPKTDEEIAYMMNAGNMMFQESGGEEISRYLAVTLAGFLHARSQNNKELEAQCAEAMASEVNKDEYKFALLKSAKFFKKLGSDFEELIKDHLKREGFNPVEIQERDKKELLEEKIKEGDEYSKTYLWWYNSYEDFEEILKDLLLEV